MLKIAAIGLAAATLAACAGVRDNLSAARQAGEGDPLQAVAAFALTDLRAALADAQAHGDALAAPCWTALIALVERAGTSHADAPVAGGFSAFQRARNLTAVSGRGMPDALRVACAPVVLDTQATVARLAAIGGGAVATGGLSLPFLR